MSDDVSEVRRVDQAINHGNELWRSFALRAAGTVIEIGGDEGALEIGAEHLPEVTNVAKQYSQAVGATVSVGIGMKLSESAKALMVAKLRGKDQIVLWKPEMQAEIDAAPRKDDAAKQSDEYLNDLAKNAPRAPGKFHGAHAGFGDHSQPRHQGPAKPQEDHEQAAVLEHMIEDKSTTQPEQTHSADDLEDQLHSAASKQREIDESHQQKDDSESKQLKSQLVQVLNVVKDKAPIIAQLKQADPEAYGAVMSLVQGVIALGRKVMGPQTEVDASEPQAVSKAEELEKAISSIPAGPKIREPKRPGDGDYHTVHDYSHVLTPEHKAKGLKLEVHEYGSDEEGPTELRTHLLDKYDGYVGQVSSYIDRGAAGPSVEPHSDLSPNYRGKGLGQSMYEATYAHAKHSFGATHVAGGIHSEDASKLHQRLAQKHGFEYVPRLRPAHQEETEKYPFNDYRYALKQELEPSIHEDHFMGPGGGLTFSRNAVKADPALEKDETSTHYGKESPACGSVKKRSTDHRWYMTDCPKCKKSPAWQKAKTNAGARVKETEDEYSGSPKTPEGFLDKSGGPIPGAPGHIHLNLPSGSVVNGKMKVAHGDGTSSWVQMNSGMVSGSEPDAPLMGANSHPVSSREPGAR